MDPCPESKVKQVLILTGDPPEAPGGMEHVNRQLMSGLTKLGYTVEVLHRHNSAPGWISHPTNKWQGYCADAMLSWYLGRRVQASLTDNTAAVISNGPFGWHLPNLKTGVRKIHFYHGTYRGQADGIRPFISWAGAAKLRWWDSMVLERFSGQGKQIVCNSDQTCEEVRKFFGYRGTTVWLPLDTSHFSPMDRSVARQRLGLSQSDRVGLFVGNTHPTKGFSLVTNLIEALPKVKWLLALRGDVPKDISQDARVLVHKDAPYSHLPVLYNAADFTVCPSRYEAFGYVVAEALACGTPVIASPGGASRLLLSGHPTFQGFVIEQLESPNHFRDVIMAVLERSDFYRRLVIDEIRPTLESIMGANSWLSTFCEFTGL